MSTSQFENSASSSFNLTRWLEQHQFSEYHEIEIERTADCVFEAIKKIDITQSRIIRILFRIRGLPSGMGNFYSFLDNGFILLEDRINEEIVFGFLIGWKGLLKISPDEFKNLNDNRIIKGVWNFKLIPEEDNTILSTETRVYCPTILSRVRFSIYWFVISQFSGLIRIIMLKLIKKQAESSQ